MSDMHVPNFLDTDPAAIAAAQELQDRAIDETVRPTEMTLPGEAQWPIDEETGKLVLPAGQNKQFLAKWTERVVILSATRKAGAGPGKITVNIGVRSRPGQLNAGAKFFLTYYLNVNPEATETQKRSSLQHQASLVSLLRAVDPNLAVEQMSGRAMDMYFPVKGESKSPLIGREVFAVLSASVEIDTRAEYAGQFSGKLNGRAFLPALPETE